MLFFSSENGIVSSLLLLVFIFLDAIKNCMIGNTFQFLKKGFFVLFIKLMHMSEFCLELLNHFKLVQNQLVHGIHLVPNKCFQTDVVSSLLGRSCF